jgi:hypothetical protein
MKSMRPNPDQTGSILIFFCSKQKKDGPKAVLVKLT